MRIAFVTCHFPPDSIGGFQSQSFRLSHALAKTNEVTVFVRDYTHSQPKQQETAGLKIYRRRASRVPIWRSMCDLVKSLDWIRKTKSQFDVYISFQIQLAALILILAKQLWNIRAIVSPRGREDFEFTPFYKRYFQKFVYLHASAILIQSPIIRKDFLETSRRIFSETVAEKFAKKIFIVPNVVETFPSAKLDRQSPGRILYVGRLFDYKGVEFLLEACRGLRAEFQLDIVGDGPERKHLELLAAGMPVNFHGTIAFEDVSQFLLKADVFVLPSLTENLPNVVLEALAAGVPVIASRVGALPEIISDGENGFLVEPKQADAIRANLDAILNNDVLRKTLSERARPSVLKYTPDFVLPLIQTQLESIRQKRFI